MARAKKKNDSVTYKAPRNLGKAPSENPRWLVPTIVAFLVVGLAWIVVHYVTQGQYPLPLYNWNVAVGFGCFAVAMGLLTRWK
ncbi:cell division protein CrgA [Demequina capsici]|uniref:Cell division protein CrgA n=1 Tax=Demequina capsici TaxID=3075620 RepID=A0AA96J7Z6_9MICO|nr:cell division protein CrgA [Demequina sp. OYTSA14]WNM24523.1 cell division protein CrgA [Demequina sp. OYTSA14]